MEKEIRQYTVELRAVAGEDEKKRIIEGRAIPFNTWSPNREGFRERIAPSAIEGVLEKSDIRFLYNHDNSKGFLARNNKGKGKLNIEVKEDGVHFSFEAKNDNLSKYVLERIDNGELDEMSFAFTVANDTWEKAGDGIYERTIIEFNRLYDFSVVDNSYYGISNAVTCSRFAEIQENERIENERKMKELEEQEKREADEAERKRQEELDSYYEKFKDDYKDLLK